MAELYLSSLDPYIGAFPYSHNAGIYMHKGRVYLQGSVEIAPKTEITDEEAQLIEEGGEEAPSIALGPILSGLPAALRPAANTSLDLICVYQHTTPGYEREHVPATIDTAGNLTLEGVHVPPGEGGQMWVVLWCWWDTAAVADPEPATGWLPDGALIPGWGNNFVSIDGLWAKRGAALQLTGHVEMVGGGSGYQDSPYETPVALPVGGPRETLDIMEAASIADSPTPGPVLEPSIGGSEVRFGGYTVASAPEGRLPLYVAHGELFIGGGQNKALAAGVFQTDRYTFYDVRPIPPFSKPSVGSYTSPGFANPQEEDGEKVFGHGGQMLGLSGPTEKKPGMKGMTVFVGAIPLIPKSKTEALQPNEQYSISLCVPQGPGGPGQGYYRFDFWEFGGTCYMVFRTINWEPLYPLGFSNEPVGQFSWSIIPCKAGLKSCMISVMGEPFPISPIGHGETNYFEITFSDDPFKYYVYDPIIELPLPGEELESRERGISPPPFGDAGVRGNLKLTVAERRAIELEQKYEVTPRQPTSRSAPLWVAEYPFPAWKVLEPGDVLDLSHAGWGAPQFPGVLNIGEEREGVIH